MIGIVATGQLAKLTRIPYPLIGGVFIPIAILGAVISWTTWLALPVMAVFMGIGLIMKIFQWPRPPLLLGIILGPIIEEQFLSALNVVEPVRIGGFESEVLGVLLRPLTIALIVLAVATAYLFARAARSNALVSAAPSAQPPAGASGTGGEQREGLLSKLLQVRNLPIWLLLGGGAAFLWGTLSFDVVESWVPRASDDRSHHSFGPLAVVLPSARGGQKRSAIMDLGMHSLALPGAKPAILLITGGFVMFILLAGTIGLRWAVIALAGYLPFTLLGRNAIPLPKSFMAGVIVGVLSIILAAVIGNADTIQIIGTGVVVALAVTLMLSVGAQGVGGMPGIPGAMAVIALTFAVTVAIFVVFGWGNTPIEWVYRIPPGLAPALLLLLRPVRVWQPPEKLQWLFSWRALAPIIAMSFVFLFEFVMADNGLFISGLSPRCSSGSGGRYSGRGKRTTQRQCGRGPRFS